MQIIKQPPRTKTNKELREREFLTEDEIDALRKAIRTYSRNADRDEALILFMFRHAFRVSEIASLKWEQVDLKKGRLYVKRLKKGLDSTHPIGGTELRFFRKLLREERKGTHVFMSERKAPLSIRTIHKIVADAGKFAGLSFTVHPHMLRHACGYYLANKGTDTRAIQLYMGHSNIQNTAIYTQLSSKRFTDFFED